MNRFLRLVFFALALLLAGYAAMFANYLHAIGEPVAHSKMVWVTAGGAVFLAFAGWRFSLKSKFNIFAVLMSLVLVELLLQAAAWLGVLPAVHTKLKAPYARVYWTAEGRGNGIRNRDGWYYPAFDSKAPHKIAFIGDSQIEAVEVLSTQNQAADLQTLLKQKSPDWAVLGLGNHGSAPAHTIDVLEYAWRHFQPQEAILALSMGSDVTEASPVLNNMPPEAYLYYDLDADGQLVLNPGSVGARARFDRSLEFSHQPLLTTLPVIINSHCMILQLVDSLLDNLKTRRRQAEIAAQNNGVQQNGFNSTAFAVDPSPEAQRALAVLLAELGQCKTVCDSHGMKMRLVTIPAFPRAFYDSQHGRNWTMRLGEYDYFGPERVVTDWARTNGILIVSMGEQIQQKKMDVDEIRSLYYSNGTGHLTVKGHALCAQTIYENFYQQPAP